jgi:transcriptional regulator of heat shock response
VFLYEFAEKTAQKPDTVATYVRRNKKIFKNHVERRQKQIWLDKKAVDVLLRKYPEVQKKPLNKEKFEEIITKSLRTLYENQEILAKEIDEIRALVEELEESFDHKQAEQQKEDNGLISLERLFGEDTQVDRLTRQVREQGEKIELLQREISVLQNEKKSFFGFKRC